MNRQSRLRNALADLMRRLAGTHGREYWHRLEELAHREPFRELVVGPDAPLWGTGDPVSRRQFLALMGASLALAGLSGCSVKPAPNGTIVPYVHPPETGAPGRPLFFATATADGDDVLGVLVESHLGRPIKIEGNPDHPASLGGTDAFAQAAVLTLYDPDRAQIVTQRGQTRTWQEASRSLGKAIEQYRAKRGKRMRLLTAPIHSPTLAAQIDDFLKRFPEAKWHQYDPLGEDPSDAATRTAFGQQVHARYDFSKADVVLSLDSDFFTCGAGKVRYAADFMARRRIRSTASDAAHAEMNRLYVVETAVSCTGAKADHRLAVRPRQVEAIARAIAGRLGLDVKAQLAPEHETWAAAVVKDLQARRGRSLVLAGRGQPPGVHLLAHAMNDRLGSVGQTVVFTEPIAHRPTDVTQSLRELVDEMKRGQVEVLIMLGGNPVYDTPVDLEFGKQLAKVPLAIHHSLFVDETSVLCEWQLPATHFLEAWSDARAFDGTVSLVQPLIEPLYQGRSAHELLVLLAEGRETSGREIVRDHWRKQHGQRGKKEEFEQWWQTSLHNGVVADTALPSKEVKLAKDWQSHLGQGASKEPRSEELDVLFQPDPAVGDGRWANNGWLQELPKPITRLTWGNAAIVSPETAERFDLRQGSFAHGGEHGGYEMPVVELRLEGRSVRAPVWIMPGHAPGVVTVYLGHGRRRAGRVGGSESATVGFDAYHLRTSSRPWFASGLEMVKTGDWATVACVQARHSMEGRALARGGTLAQFRKNPQFAGEPDAQKLQENTLRAARPPLTMYEPFDYQPPNHRWGMLIDLTACIGCEACVVACQAENNIPVVGKEQVLRGREMHWLRIDRYTRGPEQRPEQFFFQPVPCMHCEHAPCEYVCPTEATVHSAEGLNEMIYNRCVGTRFCSNNCPYKVRRFNFLFFADYDTPSRRLQYNPDVTVRSRGVMEKCTYCLQRIRHAEVDAQAEERPIRDGEVLTACQAVCPTRAIVFGDLNDPKSTISQWAASPLHYALLGDLNTTPRTTYLAMLSNPNPELEGAT